MTKTTPISHMTRMCILEIPFTGAKALPPAAGGPFASALVLPAGVTDGKVTAIARSEKFRVGLYFRLARPHA
jgi:hypothetical protein